MAFTNKQANEYAAKYAVSVNEHSRIYDAVIYGMTLKDVKQKAIGDPLEQAAFNYSSVFEQLSIEEKYRIHQAVLFGARLAKSTIAEDTFTDSSLMPFGKHKGKRMIDIPAFYLLWLYNEGCSHTGVIKYIIDNLQALQKEAGQKTKP